MKSMCLSIMGSVMFCICYGESYLNIRVYSVFKAQGINRYSQGILGLCLCLSIYDSLTTVHILTVCQTPFTVTGFIKPWINYSVRTSEWLRKRRDDSHHFNNILLSFILINNSGCIMIWFYHLPVCFTEFLANKSKADTREQFCISFTYSPKKRSRGLNRIFKRGKLVLSYITKQLLVLTSQFDWPRHLYWTG